MTPREFDDELARVSVVCAKCWTPEEADVRQRWREELRKLFGGLAQITWMRTVDIIISEHRDPKALPLPIAFKAAHTRVGEHSRAGSWRDKPAPTGGMGAMEHHQWMCQQAASCTPAQAKTTLKIVEASKMRFPEEVIAILKEAQDGVLNREPEKCVSGSSCSAGPRCIEKVGVPSTYERAPRVGVEKPKHTNRAIVEPLETKTVSVAEAPSGFTEDPPIDQIPF